jgi:hypothetical protein
MWLDNDRMSHWFAGVLLSWTGMFLLLGLLVFHLWLKVSIAKIANFSGICCVVQLAITPWLFHARSTPQNPPGRIRERVGALSVLFSAVSLLFFTTSDAVRRKISKRCSSPIPLALSCNKLLTGTSLVSRVSNYKGRRIFFAGLNGKFRKAAPRSTILYQKVKRIGECFPCPLWRVGSVSASASACSP